MTVASEQDEAPDEAMHSTRTFWNASPCNGQENLVARKKYRYRSEPWLPGYMKRIAENHKNIVEIGSGLGTDALTCCLHLPEDGSYRGIDYSNESVAKAKEALEEAKTENWDVKVEPTFQVGDAESLDFKTNSLECVFSFGVLHHTAHPQRAFDEVYRVLEPGGKAYVILYRRWALKVAVAKILRGFQHAVDFVTRRERTIYKLIDGRHLESLMGTAVLECFGVPYLDCFDKREVERFFSDFQIDALYPIGYSLPWFHKDPSSLGPFGYYWAIEITKPESS